MKNKLGIGLALTFGIGSLVIGGTILGVGIGNRAGYTIVYNNERIHYSDLSKIDADQYTYYPSNLLFESGRDSINLGSYISQNSSFKSYKFNLYFEFGSSNDADDAKINVDGMDATIIYKGNIGSNSVEYFTYNNKHENIFFDIVDKKDNCTYVVKNIRLIIWAK